MAKRELKRLIILNIPYLIIGLVATSIGEAWRLATGFDSSEKILPLITTLGTVSQNPLSSLNPSDLLIGLCAGMAIRLAVYVKGENAKKFRHKVEYSLARQGIAKDIESFVDPNFKDNTILTKTEKLVVNNCPKEPKSVRNKNVLIIGSSGSGKARFWIKPNPLQMHSSYVVTDPKGSIVIECGNALLKNHYKIKIFNTINFKKSMHYNPFAYIHSEKDISKLVTTPITNTKGDGKAGDEFWTKTETLLYCALIGYIHYEAPVEKQNFSTLIEFINVMEVREDDEDFQDSVDLMLEALEKTKPNHFAIRQYKKLRLAAGDICPRRLLNHDFVMASEAITQSIFVSGGTTTRNEGITPLHERLSRDNELQGESDSISNQKQMLEDFARRNGSLSPMHFIDDGILGTRFDRPRFLAMMEEVEAGRVEAIVIKDMSRLGRDYPRVSQIVEVLWQRGVRLITINDGVDGLKGDDDFTPFRNIMDESYARDTSRKVRSTFESKGMSGKYLTGTAIYGYLWDEERGHWLVDEGAAEVVRRIFSPMLEEYGPYQTVCKLSVDQIEIPVVHLTRFNEGVNRSKPVKDPYGWGSSIIMNILKKREYLGYTINFKTRKHFKDKKDHYVSEGEWTIFENTHEAIIGQQTFGLVQRIHSNVWRYPNG